MANFFDQFDPPEEMSAPYAQPPIPQGQGQNQGQGQGQGQGGNFFDQFDPPDQPIQPAISQRPATSAGPTTYNVVGGLKDIWGLAKNLYPYTKGAVAAGLEATEGDPFAKRDWRDIAQEKSDALAAQQMAQPGGEEQVIPRIPWLLPGGVKRKDIWQTGPSIGFSLANMVPALAARAPGAMAGAEIGSLIGGPPGSAVGGAIGAFAAPAAVTGLGAYGMQRTMFLRQAKDVLDQESIHKTGHPLTPDEWSAAYERLKPYASKSAWAEAGPEAIAGGIEAGLLSGLFKKLGKESIAQATKRIVGAGAKTLGTELATETQTQLIQQQAEAEAGLTPEAPRSLLSLEDWAKSYREVAPMVFAQTALMGGAGGLAEAGVRGARRALLGNRPIEEAGQDQQDQGVEALPPGMTEAQVLAAINRLDPTHPVNYTEEITDKKPLKEGDAVIFPEQEGKETYSVTGLKEFETETGQKLTIAEIALGGETFDVPVDVLARVNVNQFNKAKKTVPSPAGPRTISGLGDVRAAAQEAARVAPGHALVPYTPPPAPGASTAPAATPVATPEPALRATPSPMIRMLLDRVNRLEPGAGDTLFRDQQQNNLSDQAMLGHIHDWLRTKHLASAAIPTTPTTEKVSENAIQIPEAGETYGSRGAQPAIREAGGSAAERGPGLQPGRQGVGVAEQEPAKVQALQVAQSIGRVYPNVDEAQAALATLSKARPDLEAVTLPDGTAALRSRTTPVVKDPSLQPMLDRVNDLRQQLGEGKLKGLRDRPDLTLQDAHQTLQKYIGYYERKVPSAETKPITPTLARPTVPGTVGVAGAPPSNPDRVAEAHQGIDTFFASPRQKGKAQSIFAAIAPDRHVIDFSPGTPAGKEDLKQRVAQQSDDPAYYQSKIIRMTPAQWEAHKVEAETIPAAVPSAPGAPGAKRYPFAKTFAAPSHIQDRVQALTPAIPEVTQKQNDEKTQIIARNIPAFQGGKRNVATHYTHAIRAFFGNSASKITVIDDHFGGSGSWGLFHAMANFPNVKTLRLHEFDKDRLNKIKLYHQFGYRERDKNGNVVVDGFKELAKEFEPYLKRIEELMGETASAFSSHTAGDRAKQILDQVYEEARATGANVDWRLSGFLMALYDKGGSDLGTSEVAKRTGSIRDAITDIVRAAADDAHKGYANAQSFLDKTGRGGTIEYVGGDSYKHPPIQGRNVLSLVDPPYYGTTGYSLPKKPVDAKTYKMTHDLIGRIKAAGNSVIYTDEGWWFKTKRIKGKGEAEDRLVPNIPADVNTRVDGMTPADMLQSLQQSSDFFGIMQVKKRYETLSLFNGTGEPAAGAGVAARAEPLPEGDLGHAIGVGREAEQPVGPGGRGAHEVPSERVVPKAAGVGRAKAAERGRSRTGGEVGQEAEVKPVKEKAEVKVKVKPEPEVKPKTGVAEHGGKEKQAQAEALLKAKYARAAPPTRTATEAAAALKQTPFTTVAEAIGMLGKYPSYLKEVAQNMAKARVKIRNGKLTVRDVAKAYFMTVASQGAREWSLDTFHKAAERAGIKLAVPERFLSKVKGKDMLRPEEAAAAWLGSPEGQRALNALEKGEFDAAAWRGGALVRKLFGDDRFQTLNVFGDAPKGRVNIRQGIHELTDQLNATRGDPAKVDALVRRLTGISEGKSGFIASLLGAPSKATFDAQEISFWVAGQAATTGKAENEQVTLARDAGKLMGSKAVSGVVADRIGMRIKQLWNTVGQAEGIPSWAGEHIMHHWLWDRLKQAETQHTGMYEAMEHYAQTRASGSEQVSLESLGAPPTHRPGTSRDRLVKELNRLFGPNGVRNLAQSGLHIVQGVNEIPGNHPSDVAAAVIGKQTYLVADNVPVQDLRGRLLHEVGAHLGIEGKPEYAEIKKSIRYQVERAEQKEKRGEVLTENERGLLNARFAVPDDPGWDAATMKLLRTAQNKASIGEKLSADEARVLKEYRDYIESETIAYGVERGVPSIINRVIALIRRILRSMGVVREFSQNDLRLMAEGALRQAAFGQRWETSSSSDALYHRVWHGTAHTFDEFKLNKIGTGEGAQVYGWGLYFADSRAVAEWYRDNLSKSSDTLRVTNTKTGKYSDIPAVQDFDAERNLGYYSGVFLSDFVSFMKGYGNLSKEDAVRLAYDAYRDAIDTDVHYGKVGPEYSKDLNDSIERHIDNLRKGILSGELSVVGYKKEGKLYQVDLSPKQDEYLDYDKSLNKQSDKVKSKLVEHLTSDASPGDPKNWERILKSGKATVKGSAIYTNISKDLGSDEAASRYLLAIGIPGIKYLQGASRAAGEGQHNYVIFDDRLVKIEARYARAGATQRVKDMIERMKAASSKVLHDRQLTARQKAVAIVDRMFNPLADLPEQAKYRVSRYLTQGRIYEEQVVGRRLYDIFRKATAPVAQAIYEYLTHANAPPAMITDPELRAQAIKAKEEMLRLGQRLVDLKVLSKKAYDALKGGYLPRMYLRFVMDDASIVQMASTGRKPDLSETKQRKDIPEDVRRLVYGEIKDPAYLISQGYITEARDIALLDWIKEISQNQEWVLPKSLVTWQGHKVTPFWMRSEADSIRKQAQAYDPEAKREALDLADKMDAVSVPALGEQGEDVPKGWQRMPDTKRYGTLRGMVVRREIYEDIVGNFSMNSDPSLAEMVLGDQGVLARATAWWKFSKVAANPPAQVRNFISNLVLLHLSGVPFHMVPVRIAQAAREILNNGEHYQVVQKYGATMASFAGTELRRIDIEFLDTLARSEGSSWARIKTIAAGGVNAMSDFYQVIETVGKTAKVIDAMEREGMSESDAVLAAQDALFDYSQVSSSTRYLRNAPLGIPFMCVDEETEALTTEGWKGIDELSEGDIVASFDMDKKLLVWKPVLSVYRSPYDGEMIHIRDRHLDMLLTPDHRVVTYRVRRTRGERSTNGIHMSLELQQARDLKKRDHIPTAAPFVHTPIGEPIPDSIVSVIGWMVTEGNFYIVPTKHTKCIRASISQNEGTKADSIRKSLTDSGIPWHETVRHCKNGNFPHVRFELYIEDARKIYNLLPLKQLTPELLMRLSVGQIELLVDTMIMGDGHISKAKYGSRRVFIQNAGQTLDTFQMALTILGLSYNVVPHGNGFAVLIRNGKNFCIKRASREYVRYSGRIWCPQVLDTETWVARRNGKPFITHNTFAQKVLPLLLRTAIQHPLRFAPYVALPYIFTAMLAGSAGVDKDDVKALQLALPKWLREKGHAYFMPLKDKYGRWDAVDFGYFFPWTQWTQMVSEAGQGHIGKAMATAGLMGSPIIDLVTAAQTGKDPFTQKDIYNPHDPPARQVGTIMNYLWRLAMPTFITDIGVLGPDFERGAEGRPPISGHLAKAIAGEVDPKTGAPSKTVLQALAGAMGVNIYPINPALTRTMNLKQMRSEIQLTRSRMTATLKDRNLTSEQRVQIRQRYLQEIKDQQKDLIDYAKLSRVNPKLLTTAPAPGGSGA